MGRTEFPDPQGLRASLWLEQQLFIESEMALFFERRLKCPQNMLDTADIVREAIYRQLTGSWHDRWVRVLPLPARSLAFPGWSQLEHAVAHHAGS